MRKVQIELISRFASLPPSFPIRFFYTTSRTCWFFILALYSSSTFFLILLFYLQPINIYPQSKQQHSSTFKQHPRYALSFVDLFLATALADADPAAPGSAEHLLCLGLTRRIPRSHHRHHTTTPYRNTLAPTTSLVYFGRIFKVKKKRRPQTGKNRGHQQFNRETVTFSTTVYSMTD